MPPSFKSAYVTPILKKADLNSADPGSYRPISNLSVISKLLERVISQQLVKYLTDNHLLPDLQSAYRRNHSTETAVLKVLADILLALDSTETGCAGVARFICSVQQRRPRHADPTTADVIRSRWGCPRLVCVVIKWSHTGMMDRGYMATLVLWPLPGSFTYLCSQGMFGF